MIRDHIRDYAAGILLGAMFLFGGSFARGDGWAFNPGNDPHITEWFQSLMQPDHPRVSCCGEADAFEADVYETEGDHYVAVITDGRGILKNGDRIPVPNDKIKWNGNPPNPTGHGIIFIGSSRQVYCYVLPAAS